MGENEIILNPQARRKHFFFEFLNERAEPKHAAPRCRTALARYAPTTFPAERFAFQPIVLRFYCSNKPSAPLLSNLFCEKTRAKTHKSSAYSFFLLLLSHTEEKMLRLLP